MKFPTKPTRNWKVDANSGWLPKSNKKFNNVKTAFRRGDAIQLSELKQEIDITDSAITKEVGMMQQQLRRQPTDAEVRQSPKVNRLLVRRDELVSAYETVVQQHRFYNAKLQTMKQRDPLDQAKKSFAGIRRANPFNEFKRSPLQVPIVTPQHRLSKNASRRGTLWDPSMKLSDVSVNPKIKSYYKRYIRW